MAKIPENTISRSNFNNAREMLCVKLGWMKEHQHFIRRHDHDCSVEERLAFIRKVTRILAYNYDVHRCPNPNLFPTLWPTEKEGSQPVRMPPEYRTTEPKEDRT